MNNENNENEKEYEYEDEKEDEYDYPLPCLDGFTVYTKKGCVYCDRVASLLANVTHIVVQCDDFLKKEKDKEAFLAFILWKTGISYRTFPMVFHEGRFLGGFSETQLYVQKQTAFSFFPE